MIVLRSPIKVVKEQEPVVEIKETEVKEKEKKEKGGGLKKIFGIGAAVAGGAIALIAGAKKPKKYVETTPSEPEEYPEPVFEEVETEEPEETTAEG